MADVSTKKVASEVTAIEEGKILDYITGNPGRTAPRSRYASVSRVHSSTSTASPSTTWSQTSS